MSDGPFEGASSTIQSGNGNTPRLIRGVGLGGATMLNMIDMIGVGPFITFPLIIAAMGGPQAMLGWILGALIVMCDGLVWAELGAALPQSGGPYNYLKEIYGRNRLGRFVSFLFIWQLTFSAPLSIASGCIGLAGYAGFAFPRLSTEFGSKTLHLSVPLLGSLDASVALSAGTFVAIGTCVTAVFLLYRKIDIIEKVSKFLWAGVMLTLLWVIVSGVGHFNPHLAFDFPSGAFTLQPAFFQGLGSALLIAFYDYWGYYNVCFIGGEIKDPGRNIPRAILLSILFVAIIYLVMNISILGVIPWRELSEGSSSQGSKFIIATFMERLYGHWAGVIVSVLIMWTALASVFSLLLGYSRVPYAAALDGNYFGVFGRVHPKHRMPYVSLLIMGGVASLFCFLSLKDVIAALVVIRIFIQFIAQIVGVIIFRIKRPDVHKPFKMWLFPLPALVALSGFLFVLFSRPNFMKEIRYATLLVTVGTIVFLFRSYRRSEWPFQKSVLVSE